jgi:N,N'-diacetyllegionaminate synthase
MSVWQSKNGVYLIAEIGGNHEGDFNYAQHLTQLACDSGVDAVKFQIYTGDSLVSKVASFQRNQHFKKFELKPEQYIQLAQLCRANQVDFLASVWDVSALEWIDPYLPFYKIGSGDLTAYPVLKKIAAMDKPILLSIGLSTMAEVTATVNFLQSLDTRYGSKDYLALLQCTSMYPIPDSDANLNVISELRSKFNLPIGYSDHTIGSEAAEVAVAMGAEIIEIHFTDSRDGKIFRDHQVSFTKDEIAALIHKIQRIHALQGDAEKVLTTSELAADHVVSFRRAVYPTRNIPAGTAITATDLCVLRPNNGIDARDFDKVLGRVTAKDIQALYPLEWSDFLERE